MEQVRRASRRWSVGEVMFRVAGIAAIWLVLTQGELRYWGLVALAVLGSTFASLLLDPGSGLGLSITGWAQFIPFFLWQSLIGGTDVALRAFARPPRIDPVYVAYRFQLTHEPARVMIANTMSLMPGTLSVSMDGDQLQMHVLDHSIPAVKRAEEVEAHAARMFRLQLPG